jgi:hypothetical protein
MIGGAWCGQLGLVGWVLMGLFWASFLALVLWALSRMFAPVHRDDILPEDADDQDQPWPRGQMDLCEHQTLHEELTASARHRDGRTR